jgi:hypothetical protein
VIERWLAEFERALRVHGRRRRRVLEEVAAHAHESAAAVGNEEALRRLGDPREVAGSFTPRPVDRLYEQRDRLAALVMLGGIAASLPLAWTLSRLGREQGSHAWAWFLALLVPTAAVAVASCVLVLARRPAGARLARVLAVMVLATAAVVTLDLPPAHAEFGQYQAAVRTGDDSTGCAGRTLARCASDHAWEIRWYYSGGAVVLATVYLWAVSGWTPRRRPRPQRAVV